MTLRFKSAGLVRGNHKKTYTVPYEEINDPRFDWAEDYEQIPYYSASLARHQFPSRSEVRLRWQLAQRISHLAISASMMGQFRP
jgi:hypothetical protein